MNAPISPFAPKKFPKLPQIKGLHLAAGEAGIRYSGRTDLMLAVLDPGTTFAGVFTRSLTRSPAVAWSEERIAERRALGAETLPAVILVNSGNANAFTGAEGAATTREMARMAALAGDCTQNNAFIASTGVIGEHLPVERIRPVIDSLRNGLAPGNWEPAARAIMTTDTFPKGASATCVIDNKEVRVAGIAKGSGMIAPNMATMLGFLFTDAAVLPGALQSLLVEAIDPTMNAITVDGDCSTSDTVLLAATGQSKSALIEKPEDPRAAGLRQALFHTLKSLAQQIIRDGEGASKFVTILVVGAQNDVDARLVAFSVANSPMVKTSIAGGDPNWGRIVMAVGKSGAKIYPDRLTVRLGSIQVTRDGAVASGYSEDAGAAYMQNPELEIGIDIGLGGPGKATVWTCDLSARYVEINADYRS